MPDCESCKRQRSKEGKPPRALKRMPIEVTQDKTFKRKGVPLQLCDYCDGDAIERVMAAHEKRKPSNA